MTPQQFAETIKILEQIVLQIKAKQDAAMICEDVCHEPDYHRGVVKGYMDCLEIIRDELR